MKKFLSLVLALVMTMSLVTVSAGAKDFTDSEDLSGEAYAEAVNVMSEMGNHRRLCRRCFPAPGNPDPWRCRQDHRLHDAWQDHG